MTIYFCNIGPQKQLLQMIVRILLNLLFHSTSNHFLATCSSLISQWQMRHRIRLSYPLEMLSSLLLKIIPIIQTVVRWLTDKLTRFFDSLTSTLVLFVSLAWVKQKVIQIDGVQMPKHVRSGDLDHFNWFECDSRVGKWLALLQEEDLFAEPVLWWADTQLVRGGLFACQGADRLLQFTQSWRFFDWPGFGADWLLSCIGRLL